MELDGTDFQRWVWKELSRIPYGQTVSYGELARRIGRPNGPGRRPSQREEPDPDHRAVPPGAGQQRHRRLRRWAALEACAAAVEGVTA